MFDELIKRCIENNGQYIYIITNNKNDLTNIKINKYIKKITWDSDKNSTIYILYNDSIIEIVYVDFLFNKFIS